MASNQQMERIMRYGDMIRQQAGLAVRPYRADGYVNMMTRYGTSRDISEQYRFVPEQAVPDELLTMYYEGNGLFAKIIDTPAEEALKHGFHLNGIADQKIEDFFSEALDELDWEETAMTAIKWARLYGGSIAVLLVNDGRGLEEPLDWKNIRSIDDIRVYDRSLIQADTSTMFDYRPDDPFRTRGSRLGMPEYYHVFSRYGNFTVHDSRCLVFRNGILPEGATNSEYQLWGTPEYVRIHKAIRDAEIAHGSAPKLLDRSVQPVYKMKDLQQLLATEEGEDQVLRRLRVIDMARGLLNSLVIDKDGEEYDFKTFTFAGVSNVISAACNMLSAITNIPQTILFGQTVGGLSTTDDTSTENYYNFVERIQQRMLRSNLRYLLSIIFQAGVSTGEVDEVPKIKVEFNPLWSLSDVEQADLDQKKANTQNLKARTAQIYVDMQAMDSSEVRKSLASSDEFDVEDILDEMSDDDLFPPDITPDDPGDEENGNAPDAAPAATKLPEDMSKEEQEEAKAASRGDGGPGSGNFEHEGRPGEVGGSLRTGESVRDGFISDLAGAKNNAAFGEAVEKRMKDMPVGTKIKTATHSVEKISDDEYKWQFKDEPEVVHNSVVARNAIMKGVRDGSIEVEEISSKDVASAMVSAGELDPKDTDVKIPSMEPEAYKGSQVVDVSKEQFQSFREELQNGSGKAVTNDEVKEYLDAIDAYRGTEYIDVVAASAGFSDGYERYSAGLSDEERAKASAQSDTMERLIQNADKFEGKVMRALGFDLGGEYDDGSTTKQFESLVSKFKPGKELDMGHLSSWTTGQSTISQVLNARTGVDETAERSAQVVFTCPKSNSGVDVGRFSTDFTQGEVVFSKNQKFRVKSVKQKEIGDADWPISRYEVEVEEVPNKRADGVTGSGNWLHEGRPGRHDHDTDSSVGVLVVKDGQILCGIRGRTGCPGMICGPGGHVKEGETYEQAAVRETEEEFGIRPKELLQIGYGPVEADTGAAPALFLCTDYDGTIVTDDNEMMFARFMDMNQLLVLIESGVAFQPFADSLGILLKELSKNGEKLQNRNETLDKDTQKVIIKLPHPQHGDGGPGSGNHEHSGIPGQVGGSAPGPGSVSPEGENAPCVGFSSPAKLADHAKRHGLLEFGISSAKEYQQKGIDFLKQPCGGDIVGYVTGEGKVVRFNASTTEYASGFPGGKLCTYMSPKFDKRSGSTRPDKAKEYYELHRNQDLSQKEE